MVCCEGGGAVDEWKGERDVVGLAIKRGEFGDGWALYLRFVVDARGFGIALADAGVWWSR